MRYLKLNSVRLFFALAFGFALGPHSVAELNTKVSSEELTIQETAEKRLYSGGPDQDDLAVREGVTSAKQKITRRQIEEDVYKRLFREDRSSQGAGESSSQDNE